MTPKAALRLISGLAEGARVQAVALADLVVDELWDENEPSTAALAPLGRRARLLLSQAAAALIIDAVAAELLARAGSPGGKGLDTLVEELRIGAVRSGKGR